MGHAAGSGYFGAIWARTLQAERHVRGNAETAYVLKFMWQCGPFRGIQLLLQILEATLMPFFTFNTLVYFPTYCLTLNGIPGDHKSSDELIMIKSLGKLSTVMVILILVCYEVIRNITTTHMFKRRVVSFK